MAGIDAPLSWRMQQDGYLMQISQLRDENAKLSELAVSMLRSIRCFEVWSDSFRVSSVYEQLMRELGIELNDV